MTKLYNILIILSFVGLWLTSFVHSEFEVFFGFILIFSFGILHGANDILLIDIISNQKAKYPFFKVLLIYLLTVFTAVGLFYYVPFIALILFIIFSAYHFGEQHWENKQLQLTKLISTAYYFIYGLFVLLLLFIFNNKEVTAVIKSISNYSIASNVIYYGFIIVSILLTIFSIKLIFTSKIFKSNVIKELFYLLVFAIVFKVSTLIWGFAIYFILWHSIPSLFEQIHFIYGSYNSKNAISYFKKAFPYWFVSILGIGIIVSLFKDEKLLYAIIFSFIAAVTFPHAFVLNKMFTHKKTQTNK